MEENNNNNGVVNNANPTTPPNESNTNTSSNNMPPIEQTPDPVMNTPEPVKDPMAQADPLPENNEPSMPTETAPMSSNIGGGDIPTNNPPYYEPQAPMATKKSKAMLFAIIGIVTFLLLLFSAVGAVVLAAYGKINLPDKVMQEKLAFFVQDIPFMPKTPKYLLLKSAQVHQNIGSAYTKISLSAKSSEFTQIPGIGDTLEFLIEGPVDSTNPEDPKLSWNMKFTKELDVDFKVLNETMYFRVNKLPTMIYPFIGLTANNFASNPITNRWVSYDLSTLDTDASQMLDERGDDVAMDDITEEKLTLIGEKLADKMVLTDDQIDGAPVHKISLKLTNAELQELEPEIMDLLEINEQQYDTSYTGIDSPFSMIDNLQINVFIEKGTYYMRRFDAALDINETQMNDYSQVLGVRTVANETSSTSTVSIAISASLSRLGEQFDADFTAPTNSITLEQYVLEISAFFQNQQNQPVIDGTGEGFSSGDDLSGFEDPQIYSPPTGKANPDLNGFGEY